MVNFWDDFNRTHLEMSPIFASLANPHSEPNILTFVRANADDMPDLALRYCKWEGKQPFLAFKNGKHVTINGASLIEGAQREALKAAFEKN